jgi:hypothetical protein
VAAAGSFLIDAETRLSAGAGSTYFGASGGPPGERPRAAALRPSTNRAAEDKAQAGLAKLPATERRQAETQRRCPITGELLGSMGKPVLVMLQGQAAFLCCKGCEEEAKEHADQTLAKVKALRQKQGEK